MLHLHYQLPCKTSHIKSTLHQHLHWSAPIWSREVFHFTCTVVSTIHVLILELVKHSVRVVGWLVHVHAKVSTILPSLELPNSFPC